MTFEPPPLPAWFLRWLEKHPGADTDTLPPPPGYSSWQSYWFAEANLMTIYNPLGPPAPEGAKATMVFTRDDQDVAVMGLHFVKANPGVAGDTLAWDDAGDSATVEGYLTTLWNAIKGLYHQETQLGRFDWHHFGVGIRRPNPAFRSTVIAGGNPGTAEDIALPPQCACAVTQKTTRRKSWGRCYLPAPTIAQLSLIEGYFSHDFVDAVRTAFGTMLDSASGNNTPLVVWCPRHAGGALAYGDAAHAASLDEPDDSSFALSVDTVQVDDVVDVIRRRRDKPATYKQSHTLP